MRRMATAATVVVLLLLLNAPNLMAGGGIAPPLPGDKKITGPAVNALIVIDSHAAGTLNNDVTLKSRQASIRVQKGAKVAGATFRISDSFQFDTFGCDLSKMTERFVITAEKENKLVNWIPLGIITQIFGDLGISVTATNEPVITDVDSAVCTLDPENPSTPPPPPPPGPGILSFQAVIQFLVPQN